MLLARICRKSQSVYFMQVSTQCRTPINYCLSWYKIYLNKREARFTTYSLYTYLFQISSYTTSPCIESICWTSEILRRDSKVSNCHILTQKLTLFPLNRLSCVKSNICNCYTISKLFHYIIIADFIFVRILLCLLLLWSRQLLCLISLDISRGWSHWKLPMKSKYFSRWF